MLPRRTYWPVTLLLSLILALPVSAQGRTSPTATTCPAALRAESAPCVDTAPPTFACATFSSGSLRECRVTVRYSVQTPRPAQITVDILCVATMRLNADERSFPVTRQGRGKLKLGDSTVTAGQMEVVARFVQSQKFVTATVDQATCGLAPERGS